MRGSFSASGVPDELVAEKGQVLLVQEVRRNRERERIRNSVPCCVMMSAAAVCMYVSMYVTFYQRDATTEENDTSFVTLFVLRRVGSCAGVCVCVVRCLG